MSKNISLVILAAGMGSRYGSLKQIDAVGSQGESIIDFSIYDAIEAGFTKLYLIIRKEHETIFEESLVAKLRGKIEVEYIHQSLEDIPVGYSVPEGREKPWGTTHAVWAGRHQVKEPFMVCNADDYYGKQAFKDMANYLQNEIDAVNYSMVGFQLVNTLTDNGTVTRGICQQDNGYLVGVVETSNIQREGNHVITTTETGEKEIISEDALASMNFWGFTPAVFAQLEVDFINFLNEEVAGNPLKSESLLPTTIGKAVDAKFASVKILPSFDRWFGVTYKEDKPYVVETLRTYKEKGLYPENLWK